MSHSLVGADRNTHFRIIAVALVSAIVLVVIGLMARIDGSRIDDSETATAQLHANGSMLKAGKPPRGWQAPESNPSSTSGAF